jgi:N-acetylglucosaminyldiphosphoundecaprenol N-acetyl-beta-D-mannosaminyltransferase
MQPPPAVHNTCRGNAPVDPPLFVLGVRVDAVTAAETLALVADWVDEARRCSVPHTRQIVTLNPEMVMAARADPDLRDLINHADLVLPDGTGVVWAAWLRGWRDVRRITGVDTLVALAELAAARGWHLFFLGAAPGVAESAAERLRERWPGLTLAGTHVGKPDRAGDEQAVELICAGKTDILCVAYGSPAQERWIARNRDRLGGVVALGVGGALDFLAGRVPRAPRWMRRSGLEWAYRLWRQPWRWRRMRALPRFAAAALREQSHRGDR